MKCQDCQTEFLLTNPEKEFIAKNDLPPRNQCFDCNQKHRLSFRNERNLYRSQCHGTNQPIISMYSEDKPYIVYKNDYWHSDNYDPMEHGQDFDFNRPFFEQFAELQLKVPRLALSNVKSENSEYCNTCYGNKNSYLVFGGDYNEDTIYGTLCMRNKDVVDCDYSNESELSYFLLDSFGSYGSKYVFDSKNCKNCHFISDCTNCSECILCTSLSNKSHCILNKQYSKEEYLELKEKLINGSHQRQQENLKKFLELRKSRKVKYAHIVASINSTGDYIQNSKNCINCFNIENSEDITNMIFGIQCKDSNNCSMVGHDSQLLYECLSTFGAYDSKFSFFIIDSSQIEYSEYSINSENLFGCISLRRKSNCILNKQYTPEGFKQMREKIIAHMKKTGEWGRFFPKSLSCFNYEESTAQKYYPLEKEEIINQKFKSGNNETNSQSLGISTTNIPDEISNCTEEITKQIFQCQTCNKDYKITPQEFKFYQKTTTPIPHNCPDCRHRLRLNLRNPHKLFSRQCQKCQKPIETTYSPSRPETILCEKCYLEEVY